MVFEIKTAPKKREHAGMRWMRDQYAAANTLYLGVGGYASFNASTWRDLVAERWLSVCSGGVTGAPYRDQLPRFDDLLENARDFLTSA